MGFSSPSSGGSAGGSTVIEMNDNVEIEFGSDNDYSLVYSSANDAFQIQNGVATDTDVRLAVAPSGNIGINDTTPDAQLDIVVSAAATIGQIIQGAASQTAALLELRNSSSTILASFSEKGYLGVGAVDQANIVLNVQPSTAGDKGIYIDANPASTHAVNFMAAPANTDRYFAFLSVYADLWRFGINATALTANNNFSIAWYNGSTWNASFVVDENDGYVGIGTETPGTRLEVNGGLTVGRKSTAVSVNTTDEVFIGVTDNSTARTVTLDTDHLQSGRTVVVKDEAGTAASANNITIATEGSETIDGASTVSITANYGVARLYSDGTNWFTW